MIYTLIMVRKAYRDRFAGAISDAETEVVSSDTQDTIISYLKKKLVENELLKHKVKLKLPREYWDWEFLLLLDGRSYGITSGDGFDYTELTDDVSELEFLRLEEIRNNIIKLANDRASIEVDFLKEKLLKKKEQEANLVRESAEKQELLEYIRLSKKFGK